MDNKFINYLRKLIEQEQSKIEDSKVEIYKLQQKIKIYESDISSIKKSNNDKYLFSPNKSINDKNDSFEIANQISECNNEILIIQQDIEDSINNVSELKKVLCDYKMFSHDQSKSDKYNEMAQSMKIINEKAILCSQICSFDPGRTLVELREIIKLTEG